MITSAIENLALALDQGHSDNLKRYLESMAKFHKYSAANVLLIWSQKPNATHVTGFQTWKQLGRCVKKGEKGIFILAPILGKRKEDKNQDEEERLFGFRAAYVFDVTQTDGNELPQFATVKGDPGRYLDRLKSLLKKRAIRLEYSDATGSVDGFSTGGAITVRKGLPAAEEFSVLVHELAHEMLHHDGKQKERSRTLEETEAEAVAFVVCHAIGLDGSTSSSDYIQLYEGDKDMLLESLEAIQRTAGVVLDQLIESKTTRR